MSCRVRTRVKFCYWTDGLSMFENRVIIQFAVFGTRMYVSPRGSMGKLWVSLLMGPWNYFSALCRLFRSSNGDCLDGLGLFAVGCDEDRMRLWGHGSLLEKRVKVDLLQMRRELLPKLKMIKASQGVVHKGEGKVAITWFGAKSAVMQTTG